MAQAGWEEMATDLGGTDGTAGRDTESDTVTLVAVIPDPTSRRTWTFTGSEGSFPSWAWR